VSVGNIPAGIEALERSQTGTATLLLTCCTLVASKLKYWDTESSPSGVTEAFTRVGYVGAAKTEAPKADNNNIDACISAVMGVVEDGTCS
jgi:hypothetical protein